MKYLRETWYQAAWSEEVADGGRLTRTIAEQPILFFRASDGSVAAIGDKCPHRFAPLSRGFIADDVVHCGYHGLGFDREGQCVHNPHGPVPKAVRTPAFPVIERHLAIWVWIGDPAAANPDAIPDLSFIDEIPATAMFKGYMPTLANYQLLSDNILDLSHTNSLHSNSIGRLSDGIKMAVREEGDDVIVRWTDEEVEPNPIFKVAMPDLDTIDSWIEVTWTAPAVMILDAGVVPAGTEPRWEDHTVTLHNMIPETDTSSHYFFCFVRRHDVENVEATAAAQQLARKAFYDEDKPMIEAQQAMMGSADFWDLKPALLPIDNASVRARRKLRKLISAQQTDTPKASRKLSRQDV